MSWQELTVYPQRDSAKVPTVRATIAALGRLKIAPCPLRETIVRRDSATQDNEVEETSKALEQMSWMK
jgi:hypothetical protein